MDAEITRQHATYYCAMMPAFLKGKSARRINEAIDWTTTYCKTVLPELIIDRCSVKRDDDPDH